MSTSLQIKLFGTPALIQDGTPVGGFISNKAPAVVYFLADSSQPQTRATLAALLWSNSDEFYAKKNLRNVLSNLRDRLEPYLNISRETVALQTPRIEQIDSVKFRELLTAAGSLPPAASERQGLLAKAVALYQGPFLAGFHIGDAEVFDEWMSSERQRYHLLAVQALSALVASSTQQGTLLDGIHYASRLLALEPTHEETHRQLMLLLALDGQSSAALAQYRTCQKVLAAELGISPAVETHQLYNRIQAGEFSKIPGTFALNPAHPRPTLPAELTGFVGRETELAQVHQRLADPACRLVTIAGMGGGGKTRLALHAAHQLAEAAAASNGPPFRDGIYFVSLAAMEPTTQVEHLVATAIAASLQLPLTGATPPSEQLIQALHDKEMLLILDNCEHLPVVPFIHSLLQQTRQLKLLVTSRTRLNLRGERVIQLAGLTLPPPTLPAPTANKEIAQLNDYSAIRLFVQSVQASLPDFTLDQTTAAFVTQICQLLYGLPLGIELAATWARLLPLEEIVHEIQQNLDFLDGTQLETPVHQRSLRAVFNHSWRLLAAEEQQVLRRLAVFRGGFTREAAARVAGATLPLLAQLTDKSLVQRADPVGEGGAHNGATSAKARYELQAVVRQYAAEQLSQAGETAEYQERHAAYLARFLAAQRAHLQSAQQQDALRTIHAEIENVRAAWQWLLEHLQTAQTHLAEIEEQVSQSFDSLFHFYDMRSWFQEGETVFGQLAQRLPAFTPSQPAASPSTVSEPSQVSWRLQAKAQARQGWFAFHLGRYTESRQLLEESLHRLEQLQAEADTIFNRNYLGALLRHIGEFAQATTYLQAALRLAHHHNDAMGTSIALNILGQIAFVQGDLVQARRLCQQALQIKRVIGDRWGMAFSLGYLGRVAQATGDYAAAQKLFSESLSICRAIGDQRGAAFALQNLGDTAHAVGDLAAARERYQESLVIYRAIGNRAESSLTLARLGDIYRASGDHSQARQTLREALALAWVLPATPGLLAALLAWATLAQADGQPEQALPPLRFVYQHPASSQQQRQQAEQLLNAAGTDAVSNTDWDLAAYVEAILSER